MAPPYSSTPSEATSPASSLQLLLLPVILYANWELVAQFVPLICLKIAMRKTDHNPRPREPWQETDSPSAIGREVTELLFPKQLQRLYVVSLPFPMLILIPSTNVHCVGRTGCAEKKGISYTYFTTENARLEVN
ncbi:hypothetical protein BT96DRAFT_1010361 [Gymnopus androsaceus JB14]|uniref:Uncharacterized protein n=1 Tax=Gymnopus androsaceus JB14 TaxID=1447944 RepID=A0A6A4GAU7_9AGAR|nr:hypothetical protein BT96DRAFT_1010361 [Gymnopus androsaceus JB14]